MSYQVYFQKASLKSYTSLQVIVAASLFGLQLLEGSLATLDVFLHATPFISFTIFYVLMIFYPVALPLFSIFAITLLSDIFFTSLQNSQTFAILVSLLIVKRLMTFPEQKDFLEIWQGFAVAMMIMVVIEILSYMIWEWSLLNLQGLVFQVGLSLLLYPFIHVVVTRMAQIFVDSAER